MRKVVEIQCVSACLCTGVYVCLCVCMSVIDCMRVRGVCARARVCVCVLGKHQRFLELKNRLAFLLRTHALPLILCFSLFSLFRPLSQCVFEFFDVTLSHILLDAVSACGRILLGTVSATTCSRMV